MALSCFAGSGLLIAQRNAIGFAEGATSVVADA